MKLIQQASSAMRATRILPLLLGFALASQAQETNVVPENVVQTNAVPTNAVPTNAVPTYAVPTYANSTNGFQTNVVQLNPPLEVRQLSLRDCIQLALEKNLDIRIQRYNPQIALTSVDFAKAGYDPTFFISGRHDYSLSGGGLDPVTKLPSPRSESDMNSFNSRLGGLLPFGLNYNLVGNIGETYGTIGTNAFDNTRGQAAIQLNQPLLRNFWIDGTRLNIAMAKLDVKGTEQQLRGQILDTISNVERAYYDLVAARQNVEVQREALHLAEELLAEDRKRVEFGALAPLSESQDEAQVASVRATLIAAMQTVETDENTLKQLIGDDYAKWSEVDIEPNESLLAPVQIFDQQESWRKALTQRPDIVQAKLTLEQSGVQLKYSHNQLFPQLDLIGSYGHAAGGAGVREFNQGFENIRQGDQPFFSYGAQLSIPLWNKAARSQYQASKLAAEQNLLSLKRLEQTVMVTIANDIGQARASLLQVESTREASKYAQEALEAEQKKLENGKSTNFEVLTLQSRLTTARSAEIQALADYNKALSQLSHDETSSLDRHGIDLQVK